MSPQDVADALAIVAPCYAEAALVLHHVDALGLMSAARINRGGDACVVVSIAGWATASGAPVHIIITNDDGRPEIRISRGGAAIPHHLCGADIRSALCAVARGP